MRWLLLVVLTALLMSCSLSEQIAGGSSDSGNPCVSAAVVDTNGRPVAGAAVTLVPARFLMPIPYAKARAVSDVRQTVTDDSGYFRIDSLDSGDYCIEVNDLAAKACRIHCRISPSDGRRDLGCFLLQPYAAITGTVDTAGAAGARRYLQIYGLQRIARIQPDGSFSLDSIPADSFDLRIVSTDNSVPPLEVTGIVLSSGDTTFVHLPWRFAKALYLNTTATGANITRTVAGFPILIRLTKQNFEFNQAQTDGRDLRFTKSDGTLLPYEIERWDAVNRQAEIWVKVDTVYGNNASQHLTMFWGNGEAEAVSTPEMVFDTAMGFEAVWHLGQGAGEKVPDATANHYDGTPNGAPSAADGMIGSAQSFNGSTDCIEIPNTAASKLNFPEHGIYAISAWVNANAIDSTYRMIVSKGDYQYSLEIMDSCTWEFAECQTTGQTTEGFDVTQSPAAGQTWAYVTGVRNGARQYLFVDGVCVDSTTQSLSAPQTRNLTSNVMIGRRSDEAMYFFNGRIDEVRMSRGALSADWIKLCYMNQKPVDALVEFK